MRNDLADLSSSSSLPDNLGGETPPTRATSHNKLIAAAAFLNIISIALKVKGKSNCHKEPVLIADEFSFFPENSLQCSLQR
jgi:hypothetical protein